MRSMNDTLRKKARHRAAYLYPTATLPPCEKCGAKVGRIPRHHPDIDNDPDWVVILCDRCHVIEDRKLGKNWVPLYTKGTANLGDIPQSSQPVVHVIGPPGVGKSTLIGRYLREHEDARVVSIDKCRLQGVDPAIAATEDAQAPGVLFLESSGLNQYMRNIAATLASKGWRPFRTIGVRCSEDTCRERLSRRNEAQADELIEWTHKRMPLILSMNPDAIWVRSDHDCYSEFEGIVSGKTISKHVKVF